MWMWVVVVVVLTAAWQQSERLKWGNREDGSQRRRNEKSPSMTTCPWPVSIWQRPPMGVNVCECVCECVCVCVCVCVLKLCLYACESVHTHTQMKKERECVFEWRQKWRQPDFLFRCGCRFHNNQIHRAALSKLLQPDVHSHTHTHTHTHSGVSCPHACYKKKWIFTHVGRHCFWIQLFSLWAFKFMTLPLPLLVCRWGLRSPLLSGRAFFTLEPKAAVRGLLYSVRVVIALSLTEGGREGGREGAGLSRWTVRSCVMRWWWEAESAALCGKASSDFTSRAFFV